MNILQSIASRFQTYKELGERAMAQLTDEQFFHPAPEGQNDIPILIRHLHGNMLSRFTNFLTEDGEKPWRERDAEFEASGRTRAELMDDWQAGWKCLFNAMAQMSDAQLEHAVLIRGEAMPALDALLRQLAHYSYHVGQIVTLCRQQSASWSSMSIPRGQSKAFTATMLSAHHPISGG